MSKEESKKKREDFTVNIEFEKHRLIIHHRYEWLHIINDIIIAIWFFYWQYFFLLCKHAGGGDVAVCHR